MNRASGSLNIVDVFEGEGRHLLQWHFRFAPGVEVVQCAGGRLDVRAPGMRLRLAAPPDLESTLSSSWYSPSYGRRHPCIGLDLQTSRQISGRCEYQFHLTCDDPGAVEPQR
jgi:hypothetical protein